MNLNDICIVIQGPTNYYKQVLDNIDPKFDYVWSTWATEPYENLREINKQMLVVASNPPPFPGTRNINMQCLSTVNGISRTNKKLIVKVRGDLLWTGQQELISRVFTEIERRNTLAAFLNYKPSIGQVHDFVSFSTRENALKIWSYYQQPTFPDTPPECQLVNHMMSTFGKTYDELVNSLSFTNVLMEEGVVDLYCIKYSVSLGNQCNTDLFGVPSFPKKGAKLCQ